MGNLADIIESFILSKLADEEHVTVLRRNELADELACAPSQISYVLSTRFTVARGFIVESRRGLGGFIRIVRVPVRQIVYEDAVRQVSDSVDADEADRMIENLHIHGFLSGREAAIMHHFFQTTGGQLDSGERARILRSLLRRLVDLTEEE
jgi:transcriptional regulator CtsR